MVARQLRNIRGCQFASKHALLPLPATLPGAQSRSDESSFVRQADPVCFPRLAYPASWNQASTGRQSADGGGSDGGEVEGNLLLVCWLTC